MEAFMTRIRFAAAVAATLVLGLGGPALAESNTPAAVETPPAAQVIQGGGIEAGGGSEAYPAFAAARSTVVTAGDGLLLPGNGDGPVQTAASLPRGAMEGTVAYAQALSVARFLAEREGHTRLAARHPADAPRG
jgi:hypothetical protein